MKDAIPLKQKKVFFIVNESIYDFVSLCYMKKEKNLTS